MTTTLTPLLAKAVLADLERDLPRRRGVRAALRGVRRRRVPRTVALVPAPVRMQRPAGW